MWFFLIIFLILVIAFLVYLIKFRNSCVYQLERIESQKSNIRILKAKYLNVLSKTLDTNNSVNKSLGAAYGVANASGAGRFIGGARGEIDNFEDSTNIVYKLANEFHQAQNALNNSVNTYNNYISKFPSNLLAKMLKFTKEEYIDSENLELSMSLSGFDEEDL